MLNSEHVSAVPLVARPAGRPGGIGAGRREWPGPICCGPFIAGPRARADAGARHGAACHDTSYYEKISVFWRKRTTPRAQAYRDNRLPRPGEVCL